jgi:hypothetical protein
MIANDQACGPCVEEHSLTGEVCVGVPVGLESDGRHLRMPEK